MGLKLRMLSWWTPNYIIRRELEYVADHTTGALESLLPNCKKEKDVSNSIKQNSSNIKVQRENMADTHTKLVKALEVEFGHEKAVSLGREKLFSLGEGLGKLTRNRLGVGDNPKDTIEAAKILYRIFDIDFHLEWFNESSATLIIDRCSLAEHYSPLTCEVLSATDEGIIHGLLPSSKMKFKEYITSGCKTCKASIHFDQRVANK
jgi:hypothetical protein